jgi:predicted TIM-barrel fold metal-dependent hydrolase
MIDTHIHLLEPSRFSYPWTAGFPALAGRFDHSDYVAATKGLGIEGGVFMEVDCAEMELEARHFCEMAETPGCAFSVVVAAARPEHEGFGEYLDAIAHPRLAGIRRVLHTKPDDLSRSSLFRQNVALLGSRGLSFDLCVTEHQLPLAQELAAACPQTTFILDHCGCPGIASHADSAFFEIWKKSLRPVADLPNVVVKLSGITAYASPEQRNASALRPYIETLLDFFGPGSILWGGDWPVVNLGNGLPAWAGITREIVSNLSHTEQSQILTSNARRIYRIP